MDILGNLGPKGQVKNKLKNKCIHHCCLFLESTKREKRLSSRVVQVSFTETVRCAGSRVGASAPLEDC